MLISITKIVLNNSKPCLRGSPSAPPVLLCYSGAPFVNHRGCHGSTLCGTAVYGVVVGAAAMNFGADPHFPEFHLLAAAEL